MLQHTRNTLKLNQLTSGRFQYETGDKVNTPFGPGFIVQDLGQDKHDHYFGIVYDLDVREHFGLEDKVYKLGSFQLSGIIQKKALD